MAARLLAATMSLCVLIAGVHSAAVSTQDTIVVARADDTREFTSSPVAEVTTEGPLPQVKLTEMEVTSEVTMRYAHTAVVAHMRNPAKRAQQAHFRVLLPETAFISGFVMTIDGKAYKAYVKEKEEAKQIYQEAVSQGLGAAHVEAKARDSNHFTVSVNIEPTSNVMFNLTYEEMLVRRNSVYNHAINLHPGALVPKLNVIVHIKEANNISDLRVPEVRTGNEIDATKDDAQNSQAIIVRSADGREATITFTPDLQEQERLIQIYTEKSKDSAAVQSHSYSWAYDPPTESKAPEGILGQFVVQYDVDRPKDGEVLINDGYFVHFFAPEELPPLNKHVVFVLDTSGSMMDRKIVQLREAMQTILGELNAGDYFSIVEFESSVTVHDLKEAEGEPPRRVFSYYDYDKNTTLVPPSKATPENIQKAKLIVSWLQASGGTNIGRALDVAVQLINRGVDWQPEVNATVTAPATTPGSTSTTDASVSTSTAADVAVEKTDDKKDTKNLEPIIIFLTDGDPTVGETNPKRILSAIAEKNFGPNKATIFSLAFGEDADRKFLRKVSLRNGGFMRHIYEAADAALQLHDFYRQISSPLLADVKFTYPKDQVKEGSLTKNSFRTYYAGSEVVVAGRVDADVQEITPHVTAFCGVRDGYGRTEFESLPKAPVAQPRQGYLPLERLWAYLSVKQLLDQRDATDSEDKNSDDDYETPEKKALRLSLQYSFVTPLTSLVVVKPNETNAVNAESVDKVVGPPSFAGSGVPLSINMAARPMASYASQSLFAGQPVMNAPSYAFASSQALQPLSFAEDTLAAEIEEYDGEASSLNNRYGYRHETLIGQDTIDHRFEEPPTTPVLFAPSTTPRVTPKPGLSDFKLLNYTWAESLLDPAAESLVLDVNGTTVTLKLNKDSQIPKEAAGDVECASAVGGGAGVCVYLSRCASAQEINVEQYRTTYCTVATERGDLGALIR